MSDNPTIEASATPAQAGWHLWLVSILGILWNGFGCFDFAMTASNNQAYLGSFPEAMVVYWQAMPIWMWALWALGVFGGLAGSIALLMRRKLAVALFAVSLVAAGLFAYAWWQNRRGVLR